LLSLSFSFSPRPLVCAYLLLGIFFWQKGRENRGWAEYIGGGKVVIPLVPYHAVPRLYELMKDNCPLAYSSLWSCWREIAPPLERQCQEPAYHVERVLPESAGTNVQRTRRAGKSFDDEGCIDMCGGE